MVKKAEFDGLLFTTKPGYLFGVRFNARLVVHWAAFRRGIGPPYSVHRIV